jgi:molecular chaperone GrpE
MDKKKQEEKIFKSEEELNKEKKQIEEYKNRYLRSLADYQNFEKRVNQEKDEIRKTANKILLLKFLSVLDDIYQAEIFVKDEGLRIIKNKFIQLLNNEGVEEIEVLGKVFDPHLSEAVAIVEGKEDNKIVEVVRKGYRYGDQVLRVAQVKVSKKMEVERSNKFNNDKN